MPQGVEHEIRHCRCVPVDTVRVRIPLMPQGVEHLTDPMSARLLHRVRIPLMPQGVEHRILGGCAHCIVCEDSIDAARR